jgi:WD40 repeat protein
MKVLVFFMAMFGALGLRAQSIELYGFERQVQLTCFLPGDSVVLAYGLDFITSDGKRQLGRKVILWDANSGDKIRENNLSGLRTFKRNDRELQGILGVAKLSLDRQKIYILGTQYQAPGVQLASVIHVYHILEDSISSYVLDKEQRVTDFFINPANDNELACIYVNKEINSCLGKVNLSTDSGLQLIKTYKHPWIPLTCSFSEDNSRLFVGAGGGQRRGTVEIFDWNNRKVIRSIPTKENILRILSTKERIYAVGEQQTLFYRSDNFALVSTNRNLFEQLIPDLQRVILAPKHTEEMMSIRIMQLPSLRIMTASNKYPVTRSQYIPSAKKILSIVEKNEFNTSNFNAKAPSLIVTNLDELK